jgi:hypothetical protein
MKKIIKRILLEYIEKTSFEELESFVEEGIDLSGYDEYENSSDKFGSLYNIFQSEYGWAINRMGEKKAIIEWLQGLPSVVDLPFYYFDIVNLLYAIGFNEVKDEDMDEDVVADMYYDLISDIIIKNK